jgi:hypothetical protein
MTTDPASSARARRSEPTLVVGSESQARRQSAAARLATQTKRTQGKLAPTMAWLAAMGRSASACALRPRGPRPDLTMRIDRDRGKVEGRADCRSLPSS